MKPQPLFLALTALNAAAAISLIDRIFINKKLKQQNKDINDLQDELDALKDKHEAYKKASEKVNLTNLDILQDHLEAKFGQIVRKEMLKAIVELESNEEKTQESLS